MKANDEIELLEDAFEMWYAETYPNPEPNPVLKALALRAWGRAWVTAMDRYIGISANETRKAVQAAGLQPSDASGISESTLNNLEIS